MKMRVIVLLVVLAALATLILLNVPRAQRQTDRAPFSPSQAGTPMEESLAATEPQEPVEALVGTRPTPAPVEKTELPEPGAISQVTREVIQLEGDIWARQKSARALGPSLNEGDSKALLRFLQVRHAEDEGQAGHVLKNDIMDALLAQKSILPELAEGLAHIYRDASQHAVIRDYAVQHLSLLSERLQEPAGLDRGAVQAQQSLAQDVLWEAVGAPQESIAGTAMLGLARMAESDPSVDLNRLRETTLRVAADELSQEATRLTALQLCGRLRLSNALPLITTLAESAANPMLRISAIAALGYLGGRAEMELLEKLEIGSDPRLRAAVTGAVKRIAQN